MFPINAPKNDPTPGKIKLPITVPAVPKPRVNKIVEALVATSIPMLIF